MKGFQNIVKRLVNKDVLTDYEVEKCIESPGINTVSDIKSSTEIPVWRGQVPPSTSIDAYFLVRASLVHVAIVCGNDAFLGSLLRLNVDIENNTCTIDIHKYITGIDPITGESKISGRDTGESIERNVNQLLGDNRYYKVSQETAEQVSITLRR